MTLREKAATFPETPGVYIMKDACGRVVYIGKAKSLRARVSSYFRGDAEPKVRAMMEQVADIEFLEALSEVDALIVEARLVRDTQPKYNVRLKDDKSFPLLAITRFDDFPKVWTVHETDDVDAERLGPFLSGWELREAVKVLQRIFKFATCRLEMREEDDKRRFFRPCLLYSIGRCTAPCAARISKEDYAANVESLRQFLLGDRSKLRGDLERRMKVAAKQLEYERAAELRDQIHALESLEKRGTPLEYLEGDITPIDPQDGLEELARVLGLPAKPRTIEGIDIAHLAGEETVGSLVSFLDGVPFKSGYRRYRIRTVTGIDDYASIREVVRRRFTRLKEEERVIPDIFLIDGGAGHLQCAVDELAKMDVARRPVMLSLAKREETLYRHDGQPREVRLEKAAPALRLMMYVRDEAHRFAQYYHHLLREKTLFGES
ncbi:MAG: excinuclease ABC subunit UvrC [Planctomycetes bacterium]|nr:excinuclease ABC subunit UvrC [Planctomycetota bacterium]